MSSVYYTVSGSNLTTSATTTGTWAGITSYDSNVNIVPAQGYVFVENNGVVEVIKDDSEDAVSWEDACSAASEHYIESADTWFDLADAESDYNELDKIPGHYSFVYDEAGDMDVCDYTAGDPNTPISRTWREACEEISQYYKERADYWDERITQPPTDTTIPAPTGNLDYDV